MDPDLERGYRKAVLQTTESNFLPLSEIRPVRVGTDILRWSRLSWQSCTVGLALIGSLNGTSTAQTKDLAPPAASAKAVDNRDSTSEGKPKTTTAAQIQQLIERLGSDKFEDRDTASAKLLEIGEPALLPLATAERGRDTEISSRAKAIRERIEYDRFEVIALNFKRDPDPEASYGLPGWKSFSKAAGTSRPAKRLFLKMLEDRSIVAMCLEAVDKGQVPDGVFEGLPDDPQLRLRTVIGKICTEIRFNIFSLGKSPEVGDLIAMLVAIQTLDEIPLEVHETTRMLCNMGTFSRLMLMPGAAPSGRKIAGAWLLKAPPVYGSEILSMARQHQIPEARQMALRMLDAPLDASLKVEAFLSLAIFGTPEDLPTIDKFLEDPEVTNEFSSNMLGEMRVERQGPNLAPVPRDNGFNYEQTLGDVALMAGCKISGLDLEKIFPVIRISENTGPMKNTIGFPKKNPALRKNAIKIYREARAPAVQPAS